MNTSSDLKIFLVDEDPFCLFLFQQYLKKLGFKNVKAFNNGLEFLEYLSDRPDVLFIDQNIANPTGLNLLKTVKLVLPQVYVVFISAHGDMETAVSAIQEGAYECIFKGEDDLEHISRVMSEIGSTKSAVKRTWIPTGNFNFLGKLASRWQ